MKERNLIEDNRRADHFSFLYYLHEEKDFRVEALEDLCHYLNLYSICLRIHSF